MFTLKFEYVVVLWQLTLSDVSSPGFGVLVDVAVGRELLLVLVLE